MLDAGIGVLRTLPAPDPERRRRPARGGPGARASTGPRARPRAGLLSGLPRGTPAALALRRAATSLLRGAGYTAFDTAGGAPPPADAGHAGIGAPYAHVTAPLRRLVDRFGTETVPGRHGRRGGARVAARGPAHPARDDGRVGRGGSAVSRAGVDRTEAALLADRVGTQFDVVVLRASTDSAPGEVYLLDPPVLARCTGPLRLGETTRVRLVEADPATGRIAFAT